MKLRKWLAVSLAAVLTLSALHGQYRVVSAEEAGEEPVTAGGNLNAEEAAGENQPQDMEDGEITGNTLSEDGEPSDNTQSAENNQGAENDQNSENIQDDEKDQDSENNQGDENKQDSGEKEKAETEESGAGLPAETPANPEDPDTPASDLAAEEHEQDDPAGSNGDGEISDETAVPEENELLKTEEPAGDEASVENGMLESAGESAAQAGDIASGTDGNINWRIDADGKLTLSGTGNFAYPGIYRSQWKQYGDQIISVEVHITGMTDASYMFDGCSNLSSVDVSNFDTSNVTSMKRMFSGCSNLSRVDVSNFDTSNVTSMEMMFSGCSSLSRVDVSNFDTSNVTSMNSMFGSIVSLEGLKSCSNLSSVDVSNIDTSNVTNMGSMFDGCSNLSSLNVNNFDTSNVTDMEGMFSGCSSLSSLNVNNFDTSNVTNMEYMFSGCSSLSSLNVNNFDTSNVTDMKGMFSGCSGLSSLNVNNFDTSNVTNMGSMFDGCSNLSSLISLDISNFDTSNVTNMGGMFSHCGNLSSLNVSNFDTRNVTNMGSMFGYCSSLISLDISNFDTSNVTNMGSMFDGCSNLSSLNVNNFDTVNVTSMERMFSGCSSLSSVDVSKFDTSNVTDMGGMFSGCSSLSSVDVSKFDTSNVTDMGSMFDGCSNLSSVDVSKFDTSNVTDMGGMFSGCSSLSSIDVSKFDTSNVTEIRYMFSGCSSLSSLDVSNFNTSNVENMYGMFADCSSLSSLDVSNFDTSRVREMDSMFRNCSGLNSLDLSNFDASNVTEMEWMFDGCSNLTEIHSPYNINWDGCDAELPTGPDILWILPDGTEVTELPRNLPYSVTVTRRRNPKIITTTPDLNMSDVIRVKYVPYSYTVETNNWEADNIVTYSLAGGELAEGLELYPATGEIYGIPLEAGEFPIRVKAEFSNPEYLPSYADLTLTVLDNTDGNVSIASDSGYEVEQYLGTQLSDAGGIYYAVQERTDQLFVSAGTYDEFIALWLNGVKLTEGEDYTKESGSTRITVRSQTLENKTNKDGINTIAAEFRVGGDRSNALKRTAQNFRIDFQQGSSSGGGSHSGRGGSGGGSPEEGAVAVSSATAVVRLVNAAGNPLTGASLELHSTPQTAQTDRRGTAVFAGVTAGLHTLYVKDGAGNILASRKFELLFGDKVLINADQVTAKTGGVFTVQVQMKENELAILSAQEGDVYRVASAGTGDEMEPGLWLALLLLSGGLSCGLCAGYRKRRMY